MCISSAIAMFAGTKGYIGSVPHPKHGFVHVLGYQNTAINLHVGPNSMILPFPTTEEMGAENVIDLGVHKTLLDDMVEFFNERPRAKGLSLKNSSPYVKVFQSGIYHVVLASQPQLVVEALKQVPEEKRPDISSELMDWYAWKYPDHAIAVCCFTNTVVAKSEPLFWWYKPNGGNEAPIFFPAVDSHSGRLPNLLTKVLVDHAIVVGYDAPAKNTQHNLYKAKQHLPLAISDFLSPHIRCFTYDKEMLPNGDFFKMNGTLKRMEAM